MNNVRTLALASMAIFAIVGSRAVVAQPEVIDRIVAVVGKEYILQSDVDAQVDFYVFNNKIDPNTPGLKQQVLDAMIDEKLILAKALEDTTISVSEDEVTNQLDALIAQRIQQFGSEKKLEELYHMPISRLKREFHDEMRKKITASKLQQLKFADIQVSRHEVEEFYATYKDSLPKVPEELELYHLFRYPKVSDATKNAVKAKAQKILDSIKAGGDFGDFARRYSEDPGSAATGGDLGFARRGQFVKEFEEAVFSLKEKQFADIVETAFGYHIIQLLERRGESVHARHILFKIPRDSAGIDSAKAFLSARRDSVGKGVDFTELAKKYSEDKETAPVGGLLGKFSIEQFDKSLQEVVKGMKEGEVSAPIEVSTGPTTGFHIIYLKNRIPEHAMSLPGDWKKIEQLATAAKQNREYQQWVKQLRKEIYWDNRL